MRTSVVIRRDTGTIEITPKLIEEALNYYLDTTDTQVTVFAAAQQSAQADVCPECKCGDGLHEDDCSIAADMVIKSFHA